ncbi:MAG TPA: hypothetical protein VHW45_15435 [Candidatus Sulfotelmatobacter sp.]|nr:hypothetical protein [Candidatus Sulfotelmatobacter sp.]
MNETRLSHTVERAGRGEWTLVSDSQLSAKDIRVLRKAWDIVAQSQSQGIALRGSNMQSEEMVFAGSDIVKSLPIVNKPQVSREPGLLDVAFNEKLGMFTGPPWERRASENLARTSAK